MRKFKITFLVTLVIFSLIFIFNFGKSAVVYKSHPKEIVKSASYKATILLAADREATGEGSGVAVNSKGDIYYLHRASGQYGNSNYIAEPTIVVLDGKTKKVKNTWGEHLFKSPHGIDIDNKNQIWVTDISLNKVFKFSPEGQLLQTFGDDYSFGLEWSLRIRNKMPHFPTFINDNTFARPTDVTVLNDGSFVVSDGYRNHRIVKFDSNGKLEWQVNKLGDKLGEFNLPHGISSDDEGNIYVADRNNARIQVFDSQGNAIDEWDNVAIGRPFGVEVGKDKKIYVVDGGNYLNGSRDNLTSQIIILNKNGDVIERFGSWGKEEGQLKIPHDIAVDEKGNMYVAELKNKRLQEFRLMEVSSK
ncbi:peptidyl-alpha-hydroxyglycine alpha-amidating lyase family protein [Fictibacillus sp. b24]|uniref:peptidyl-alpha-hydroxyglycine alpha-amidating lyase family protein n=1 Tax=Fictibacillus sp. b24 TaxID=3055863 RepID=UPI0025A0BD20|nr:peptidyl-alpha-hydroxyglycine alpha-amidating lyase family protein [Fictibacillus sp. b24]MDM5317350.1 peptidyl-alpha-hydroxyglycine alpha-amidating lyase family protein [Fictibacillus sp. b24]